MFLLLTLQLLLLSTANGATRSRVPGEIIPVSVAHSRTLGDDERYYAAKYAVDLDFDTSSGTDVGGTWLKLTLDQLYCVEKVLRYRSGGNLYQTWTCSSSSSACTCQGEDCSYYSLTVTTDSATPPALPGCRYGDVVKLEVAERYSFTVHEIVVIGKQESEVESVSKEVKTGSDTTISCVITGLTAKAAVSWRTSSGEVSGDNFTPVEGTYSNGEQTSTLAVKGTQVNSDTAFTCRVAVANPRVMVIPSDTVVNLNVYEVEPVNKEVKAGSDTTISCVITGLTAKATVSWLTSSGEVSRDNFTPVEGTYSNGRQTSTLAVKGTQVNSDTTFTCRVTSGSSPTSAHSDTVVYLNVYGSVKDWKDVERSVSVEYNIKTTPIEIWTNKEIGKQGELSLQFNTQVEGGDSAGGIGINFETKQYKLVGCTLWKDIPEANLILTKPKIIVWRIALTYDGSTNVEIYYNDVQVVSEKLDGTLCTVADWSTQWMDRDPKAIQFLSTDTASYGYRPSSSEPSVVCTNKEVVLLRGDITGCDKSWYLLESTNTDCVFDGNKKVIWTEVHKCKTVVSYTDSRVHYKNTALCGDPSPPPNAIARQENPSGLILKCSYLRTGDVSNPQWSVQGTTQVELGGEGYLEFALEVFDSGFTTAKTKSEYPLTLPLNMSDLHMQLSVATEDADMSLAIVNVRATTSATDSEDYTGPIHYIWKDGCKDDATAAAIPQSPDDPKKERFKFKLFKFVANDDDIYIHATVKVCGTDKTGCTFTCDKRKRRAAVEENKENLYQVSLGPFIATDPFEVQGATEKMKYNTLLLTVAPLLLLLMH